jgi:hypothetical protein
VGGAPAEGLRTLDEALTLNPDERYWRPETLRVRGEVRRKQGEEELAEADFRDAIALAREMSAKTWELRAATSMARLWCDQGKRTAARDLLAPVFHLVSTIGADWKCFLSPSAFQSERACLAQLRALQCINRERSSLILHCDDLLASSLVRTVISMETFRVTGITASLANGGALEHAQEMAANESPRTTKRYDRTKNASASSPSDWGLAERRTRRNTT